MAQNQAVHAYENALIDRSHLYNGHEYIQHDYRVKVHPFFATDSLQSGSITYNGIAYHDVLMLYDVVRDELAIKMPETIFRIRPHSQQISTFSFGPYQFARIVGDSAAGVRTGFYQVLHGGRIQVLAKRIKTVHEDISGGFYKANYLVKDRYFIVKDGVYHEVKKKRSVLALFPGQTAPLKKYLRANQIKFNEQREQAITAIVQQYETLTH
ncbi:hypothetical protein [Spirosoma oryzicola]|uniref:Uncharacterized protein n=2 Tax=Spirosoma liriopis TaxID=2937440 RepID=A0ABT0HLJ2_9BACT|nr:hypothetical protein [Spirosoma oryzicola]MCK8493029.1 hypothetical protein [Spirosoma liriopis]UHG92428.1 hypothetical protein LQ777_05865 [Spirosoma oryzicola]